MKRTTIAMIAVAAATGAAVLAGCSSNQARNAEGTAGTCPATPDYGVAPEYAVEAETQTGRVNIEQCSLITITKGTPAEAKFSLAPAGLLKPVTPTTTEATTYYATGAVGSDVTASWQGVEAQIANTFTIRIIAP